MAAENDLRKIIKKIKSTIGSQFGPEALKILGEKAAEIIRRRTRLGYGVRRNFGDRHRLSPLSPRYISERQEHSRELSRFTRPGKSNLTRTGEMLDDLQPIKVRLQSVIIGFRLDAAQEKADFVSGRRPFIQMSKLEVKQLRRFKENDLAKALKAKGL